MTRSWAARQRWLQSGRSTAAVDLPGSLPDRSSCCTGHIREPLRRLLVLQLFANNDQARRLSEKASGDGQPRALSRALRPGYGCRY